MRDHRSWAKPLIRKLRNHWPDEALLQAQECCSVELGLHVMRLLAPDVPVHALWALLIGYPFPGMLPSSTEGQQMLQAARQLLPFFRGPFPWRRALDRYQQLPEQLRGYEVSANGSTCTERHPSIASDRQGIYAAVLREPTPYRRDRLNWAKPGSYGCMDGEFRSDLHLTEDLILPQPVAHSLEAPARREPISVSWDELKETDRKSVV